MHIFVSNYVEELLRRAMQLHLTLRIDCYKIFSSFNHLELIKIPNLICYICILNVVCPIWNI